MPAWRGGTHAVLGGSALAGVLAFLVYLLKMIIVFFHKGTSICQGKRLAVPIETGQNLSSWGDPGPSF